MRDIDDARDAEDERKPGRDKEQAGRRGQAVEGLERKAFQIHSRTIVRGWQPCVTGRCRFGRSLNPPTQAATFFDLGVRAAAPSRRRHI